MRLSENEKGLHANLLLYLIAFAAGAVPFFLITDLYLANAAFTGVATLVIFLVTCFIPDTSLYDPYWSVAPPVMLLLTIMKYRFFTPNAWILFAAILIWSIRLTGNWYLTYKGLRHEDWRYAAYREKLSPPLFFLVNLIGLQYVPTIVVYASFINALHLLSDPLFRPEILPGVAVMLASVFLELVSDRAIHAFLRDNRGTRRTCDRGVWNYSRHPNYLGEIGFWFGLFLSFVLTDPARFYYGLGFLLMPILFLSVSIPLMERHNRKRREDYDAYVKRTSMLLLLPRKKG